jgi:hypothetical protein
MLPAQIEIYQIFEFEAVFDALVPAGVEWRQRLFHSAPYRGEV